MVPYRVRFKTKAAGANMLRHEESLTENETKTEELNVKERQTFKHHVSTWIHPCLKQDILDFSVTEARVLLKLVCARFPSLSTKGVPTFIYLSTGIWVATVKAQA